MDYEKKYNVALDAASHIYDNMKSGGNFDGMEDLEVIFPELRESEDERIKKSIVDFIKSHADEFEKSTDTWDMLAWLEKQKEHQNNSDAPNESSWSGMISSSDKDKNLDEIAQDFVDGVKEYNPEPTWDLMQTAVCYGYHLAEQKPAEWSEEDEKDMAHIMRILDDCYVYGHHDLSRTDHENLVNKLKSLRPSWKPSEEQMYSLGTVVNGIGESSFGVSKHLRDLYEQLKKL